MNSTSQISNINGTDKTAMFDFFDAIFGWDPQWFDDPTASSSRDTVTMAQILGNNCPVLNSTTLCYDNEEEYYYTMIPLIIHEFFYGLMKDINEDQDSPSSDDDVGKIGNRKVLGIVKDSQPKIIESFLTKNINLRFKIIKISITSKKFINNDIFPRRGDLVKLKYFKKKIFAYVHDINTSEITEQNNRSFIHVYTVITRDILIIQNQKIKLKSVMPIKQNLRILQAVTSLSESPLCNSIIKPNYHDYNMSIGKKSLSLSSDRSLNPIQMKIVTGIVQTVEESKPKIQLIQGPPGTGKSTVITSMIFELINSNKNIKILLCGPSNKAVDSVLLKLIETQYEMKKKGLNINIVRIGPDEKIDPKVKASVGLSTLVSRENNSTRNRNKKESKYEEEVIKNAHVIASTLSSCYSYKMEMIFGKKNGIKIPICIVDEAGQSSEAVTLIPLMLGVKTLVLVGDPKQLPPTIISPDAKTHGMDLSLFARAENNFKNTFNNPILMLNVQYRMVDPIASWPNRHFYNGEIKNADDNIKVSFPLCHYKIFNHNETQSFKEFANKPEARIILKLLDVIVDEFERLKMINDKYPSMSVITPYRDQQQIITDMIITKCSKIEELLMAEFDKLNLHKKNNTNSKLIDEKINDKIVGKKKRKRWYRNNKKPSVYIENKNEIQIMPLIESKNEIKSIPLIENKNEIKLTPLIEYKNEIKLIPFIENKNLETIGEKVQQKIEQKLPVKVNEKKKDITDKQASSNIANDIMKIINGIAKLSLNCDNQVDKPQQKNFYVNNNEFLKKFIGSSFGICRNNKKRKLYNKIIKSEEKKAKFDELKLFEQKIKDKIIKSKEIIVSLFDKTINKIKIQDMNVKKDDKEEKEEFLTLKEIEETEITLKNIDKLFKLYDQWRSIEVNTVDSFQGQERDIIIMSCVRSRGIGFVGDPNRLNVSLTRAKHTMIICGNFHAFRKNIMWRDLLVDAETRGSYVNMNENIQSDNLKKLIFIK